MATVRRTRGYAGMAGQMDVIEVHPLSTIFDSATKQSKGKSQNNTIMNWLQLLNQGRRIPGVVNTDAHYNFHGSGWLRNYLKSPTDDPAEIRVLDVVHAAERGQMILSSGPFMEVELLRRQPGCHAGDPGEDLAAPGGAGDAQGAGPVPELVRRGPGAGLPQRPPGRGAELHARSAPERFSDATMKFDQEFPLRLERDTHVIVAAIGERSKLGPVMGPEHAADLPVAVSNPIFVDVDGGGFKANGDTLGELPTKGGARCRPGRRLGTDSAVRPLRQVPHRFLAPRSRGAGAGRSRIGEISTEEIFEGVGQTGGMNPHLLTQLKDFLLVLRIVGQIPTPRGSAFKS